MARSVQPGRGHISASELSDGGSEDELETSTPIARASTSRPQASTSKQPQSSASKPPSSTKQRSGKNRQQSAAQEPPTPTNGTGSDKAHRGANTSAASVSELKPDNRTPSVTAKSNPKGKGRAAVKPPEPDIIEVDEDEEAMEEDYPAPRHSLARSAREDYSTSARDSSDRHYIKLQHENERLRQQADRYRMERDTFASQFDALSKLRETEAESELRRFKNAAEEQARTQDTLIETLTNGMSRIKDLTSEGHRNPLKLLMKEEMDARVTLAKQTIEERERTINQMETDMNQLRTTIKELEFELKQEKEHAVQERALRQTSSPFRNAAHRNKTAANTSQSSSSKDRIALYEDLTDIIITDIRSDPLESGKMAKRFICVFSVNAVDTLSFHLTCYPEGRDPATGQPGPPEVLYTPTLDQDPRPSDAFIARLNYLATGFTFEQSQLSYFLTTLKTVTKGPESQPPDGEASESESEEDDDGDASMSVR